MVLCAEQVVVEQGQAELVLLLLQQQLGWRQWSDTDGRSSLAIAASRGYSFTLFAL
jgi:hypothetical protein